MDTKIISFSGRIGSGKTTLSHLVQALAMHHLVRDKDGNKFVERCWVHPTGALMISIDPITDKEIDLSSKIPETQAWLIENIYPFIRPFSFAEPLKEFCVDVLGLLPDSVYGNDEDKNTLTHLQWENMPGYKKDKTKTGQMTAREVMQFFGTEIVRKMYPNAWANALVNNVKRWRPLIATIDDVRFTSEIDVIHSLDGKVIRLTRKINDDNHASEKELDSYEGFDKIIYNQDQTLKETLNELIDYLIELEWLPPLESINEK